MFAQIFDHPSVVLDTAEFITTYSMKWKEDTANLDIQRQEDMLLISGKNFSQFVSYNLFTLVREGREYERNGKLQEYLQQTGNMVFRTRFTYNIYKDKTSEKIIYVDKIMPGFFKYEESLNVFDWKLSNEIAEINGYKAHKATTEYGGRTWIAWYTSDLPYSDGPYKFYGLPGLIIKLYDTNNHYEFDIISIERPYEETLIEQFIMGWIDITRNDFLKAQENLRENIISRMKEDGMDSDIQQKAAKKMANRNNPIEFR